jgi:hypothetical protein
LLSRNKVNTAPKKNQRPVNRFIVQFTLQVNKRVVFGWKKKNVVSGLALQSYRVLVLLTDCALVTGFATDGCH